MTPVGDPLVLGVATQHAQTRTETQLPVRRHETGLLPVGYARRRGEGKGSRGAAHAHERTLLGSF